MAVTDVTGYPASRTCCFTGHRIMSDEQIYAVAEKLNTVIGALYKRDVNVFLSGGALGFDMVAAITVANLKLVHKDIRLVLALPCYDHFAKWSEKYRVHFDEICRRADKIIFVTDNYYTNECMYERNRYMVDNSGCCVAWYNGVKRGGTYYTLKYAEKMKRKILNLGEDSEREDASSI